jgi:hypothetical protein
MLEQELADTPNAPHLGCKLFLHLLLLPRSLLSLVLGDVEERAALGGCGRQGAQQQQA